MIPLYTEEEFKASKCKDLLPLQCKYCKRTFYLTRTRVKQALNPNRTRGHADFCSRSCMSTFNGPPVTVQCMQCDKEFSRQPARINKFNTNFCGSSCAAKYHNAHKTTGTRVSKLEKWLQDKLINMYPLIHFDFNKKYAIDSELDIYAPSLKLALEINGIFHYKPIYGQDKLDNIQRNDKFKTIACAKCNIDLHIIDISNMKRFTEAGATKFLEMIQKIISISNFKMVA